MIIFFKISALFFLIFALSCGDPDQLDKYESKEGNEVKEDSPESSGRGFQLYPSPVFPILEKIPLVGASAKVAFESDPNLFNLRFPYLVCKDLDNNYLVFCLFKVDSLNEVRDSQFLATHSKFFETDSNIKKIQAIVKFDQDLQVIQVDPSGKNSERLIKYGKKVLDYRISVEQELEMPPDGKRPAKHR